MKMHSLYDPKTGHFTGRTIGSNEADPARHAAFLAANTPVGCMAMEGEHDHLSRRVDLASGQVVDYQPPAPSADHAWDTQARRWVLGPAAVEAQRRRAAALGEIEQLERQQARPLRELALSPGNQAALTRLRAIDQRIAQLRGQLE